jgi:hypothetical protein
MLCRILLGVIAFGYVVLVLEGVRCDKKRSTPEEREKALIALVSPYDAVRDWDKGFYLGDVVLQDGHRAANTDDIKEALIRTDGKPVLVIGVIYNGMTIGSKHFLRIRAYTHQTPFLDFWLSCNKEVYERTSGPLDEGQFYAAIVRADTVKKPTYEDKIYKSEVEIPAIELDPDKYFVTGTCLDILYIGRHDYVLHVPSSTCVDSFDVGQRIGSLGSR